MILSVKLDFELNQLEVALCDEQYNFAGLELYTDTQKSTVAEKYGSEIANLIDLLTDSTERVKVSCVTMRQARLALLSKGILDTVDSILVDQSDKISWEYATEVYRNSPIVSKLQTELNLTDEVLDTLFLEASKL